MRSSVARIADKAMRIAQEALNDARANVRKKHSAEYKQDIETVYAEAVAAWYRSYIPLKYRRTYKLYTLFNADINAEGYVNWEISEDLDYPSWGEERKPFDPFSQIFERGLHGGWVGSHSPAYSAPIPDLFMIGKDEIKTNRADQIKDEFYKVFWSRYR